MRKNTALPMILILLLLCGCGSDANENSETRFLLDTVANITANCDDETLDGAFSLCENFEKILSRTKKGSDVYRLNSDSGYITVSDDTRKIIERAIYYSDLSDGKFDITVCPVSVLWDFKNQIVPSRDEIAAALKNVDYHSINIKDNKVSLNGKKIDLGGIAKGYIADRAADYFKEKRIKKTLINLGGNIVVIGKYNIGIEMPFESSVLYSIELQDKSIVTSGIYNRYIKKNGKIYHHILDPKTGYGVENELASVTVIGDSSFDCDALSTVCMLLGTAKATELINSTPNTEAVFIDREHKATLTDGLFEKDYKIYFKEVK